MLERCQSRRLESFDRHWYARTVLTSMHTFKARFSCLCCRPQIRMTAFKNADCRQYPPTNATEPVHLYPGCFIFARKITPDATSKVLQVWSDLGVLNAWGLDYDSL